MTKNILKNQKGFALIVSLVMIISVVLIMALGLVFLAIDSSSKTRDKLKSVQSYYAAEAGIEDSLYRIKTGKQIMPPF